MKLPNLSNFNEKCKKISGELKLEEKFSSLANTLEKTCAEVSDTLGLDEKLMKLSNTLDYFGEKFVNISSTPESEERPQNPSNITSPVSYAESNITNINTASSGALNHIDENSMNTSKTYESKKPNAPSSFDSATLTRTVVPDISLTLPGALPSCKEISDANHTDPRILVYYMSFYSGGASFSGRDFSKYFVEDAGSAKQILNILKNKDWIQEKDPVSVLMASFTLEELRTFLRIQGLKVSGKKEELAHRLAENISFEDFKRKYKRTLYALNELGEKYIKAKKTDYNRAIMTSTEAIKNLDFLDAVRIYNSYDTRWGFLHASGKPHTIFAGYEIPSKRFNYIISYPMHELQNSDGLKKDLRAFLVSALMRGKRDGAALQKEFNLINQEPICCPKILNLYKQDRDNGLSVEELDRIIDSMQCRIEDDPDCVLSYYISKILYNSRHIN